MKTPGLFDLSDRTGEDSPLDRLLTCMALWGLTLQLRGDPPHLVWQGDGEDVGVVAGMICASIVGS
jgi:hypothetical protein